MQKNILMTSIGAVLVLGGVGYGVFVWQGKKSDSIVATSTPVSEFPVSASTSEPVIITPLPVPAGSSALPLHPLIDRQVSVPASFSSEAKSIILKDLEEVRSRLRANPKDLPAWIDLGVRYKAISEFEAAREAWEYVSLMSPDNITSFGNLGDLYHYHLKDYAKAEMNFLQAIHNDPKYLLSYLNLHDLYRLSYKKDTSKAADILQQGIKQNPKAIDLMVALATYYKDKGNVADARTYYQRAITLATEAGNNSLVMALKAEISALE